LVVNSLLHSGISISDAAAGEDMSLPEAASPSALEEPPELPRNSLETGNPEAKLSGDSSHNRHEGAEPRFSEGHPVLRHSRPDTTANEYMQELPESVQQMVGTVYALLTSSTGSEMTN